MVPTKSVSVPIVAELPTFLNTLHGEAPLMNTTLLFDAVISVESIWKMNTACGLPWAFSVNCPVSCAAPIRYTPGIRVVPPSSAARLVNGVRPAAYQAPPAPPFDTPVGILPAPMSSLDCRRQGWGSGANCRMPPSEVQAP